MCEYCDRFFANKSGLARHKSVVHGQKASECEDCGKTFPTMLRLERHIQAVHVPNETVRFACDICDKSFKLSLYLTRHQKEVHGSIDPFSCDVCDKQFFRKSSLSRHLSMAHGGIKFLCQHCGIAYSRNEDLSSHIKDVHESGSESGTKLIKCDACDGLFASQVSLDRHKRRAHKILMDTNTKCEYCGINYSVPLRLRMHIKDVHENDPEGKDKPFKCDDCGGSFTSFAALSKHRWKAHETFEDIFKCKYCGIVYKAHDVLARHVRVVHENDQESEEKPFLKCDACGGSYMTQGQLDNHRWRAHGIYKNDNEITKNDKNEFYQLLFS